jgi:hypothetical protein
VVLLVVVCSDQFQFLPPSESEGIHMRKNNFGGYVYIHGKYKGGRTGVVTSYANLKEPLPSPPKGQTREWKVVPVVAVDEEEEEDGAVFTSAAAVVDQPATTDANNDGGDATTTAPVVVEAIPVQ